MRAQVFCFLKVLATFISSNKLKYEPAAVIHWDLSTYYTLSETEIIYT